MRASERLIAAVSRAYEKEGPGAYGLSYLEYRYGGPAAGSAGSIVRRWREEGIVVDAQVWVQKSGRLKLTWGKNGRKTVVRVEVVR